MRPIIIIFLLLTCLSANSRVYGQSVPEPYEIGTWRDFKTAAISYTFDDNCPNQLATVVPMFDLLGYKLTLFTITNPTANWAGLQTAAANGHEIASHSATHAIMNTLTDDQQIKELKDSKDAINAHIIGQNCLTIAYSNCVAGKASLCSQYYIAARACQGLIESDTPSDFMNISSIVCGTESQVKTSSDFNTRVNNAVSSKGWCVFLLHAIDGEDGYSPTQSSELSSHLNYVKNNEADFWVSTFGNVVRYIKERNAATLSVTTGQTNNTTLLLTDNLDNAIYNYPLSIRCPLPQGWTSATVTQNGNNLNSRIVTVNAVNYIMFDAVPDAGNIIISSDGISNVQHLDAGYSAVSKDVKVWKDHDKLMIKVPADAGTTLNISFYDLKGSILSNFSINNPTDKVINILLSKITNHSGIKTVRITDGKHVWSKQTAIFN